MPRAVAGNGNGEGNGRLVLWRYGAMVMEICSAVY